MSIRFVAVLSRAVALLVLVALLAVPTARVAGASTELVVNGSFSAGQSPWQEATAPSAQIVTSGEAALCGNNSCNDQIWQYVTLPATFTNLTLSYAYYVKSNETTQTCTDSFRSALRSLQGVAITIPQQLCNTDTTGGWKLASFDVTAALLPYAGQKVQVYFQGKTSSSAASTFYVDNVSLTADTAGGGGSPSGSGVYLGVSISGVPASMTALQTFQQDANKKVAIVSFWRTMLGQQSDLYSFWFQNVFNNGSVPMITWLPTNSDTGAALSLTAIANGQYDSAINSWANTLKGYGHTIFIRWAHEMNGSWYAWGQQPSAYIAAWRHIHNLFVADGATNVQWVWCPNTQYSTATQFDPYYPGDSYVDWVGLDSYNMPKNGAWYWFSNLFAIGNSYATITALTSKPVMIAETSSAEGNLWSPPASYTKAQWITNAFGTGIPSMPRIHAIVWMNDNLTATQGCCDWSIESSSSAQSAYAQAVAPSTYLSTYP